MVCFFGRRVTVGGFWAGFADEVGTLSRLTLVLFAFDASLVNGVSDDTTDNILATMSRRWLKRMTVVTAITNMIRKK